MEPGLPQPENALTPEDEIKGLTKDDKNNRAENTFKHLVRISFEGVPSSTDSHIEKERHNKCDTGEYTDNREHVLQHICGCFND